MKNPTWENLKGDEFGTLGFEIETQNSKLIAIYDATLLT